MLATPRDYDTHAAQSHPGLERVYSSRHATAYYLHISQLGVRKLTGIGVAPGCTCPFNAVPGDVAGAGTCSDLSTNYATISVRDR